MKYPIFKNTEQPNRKLNKQGEDLISQDLFKINKSTLQRRQRNVENFFSGVFGKDYQKARGVEPKKVIKPAEPKKAVKPIEPKGKRCVLGI